MRSRAFWGYVGRGLLTALMLAFVASSHSQSEGNLPAHRLESASERLLRSLGFAASFKQFFAAKMRSFKEPQSDGEAVLQEAVRRAQQLSEESILPAAAQALEADLNDWDAIQVASLLESGLGKKTHTAAISVLRGEKSADEDPGIDLTPEESDAAAKLGRSASYRRFRAVFESDAFMRRLMTNLFQLPEFSDLAESLGKNP